MPGADSSRTQLAIRQEAVFGEAAPANAAMALIRHTGDSLVHKNITVVSDEIRSDRQRSDMGLVGYEVGGDINAEIIYSPAFGGFDTMLEAALCGNWGTNFVADGATTSGSPIVTSATMGFTAADLHRPISGAGIPANSFIGIVNSATSISLSSTQNTHTAANASATATGVTITVTGHGSVVRNGTTNRSFGIERGYLDKGKYFYFKGCELDKFAIDVTARKYATSVATFKGSGSPAATSSSAGGSVAPLAVSSNYPIRAGALISILSAGTSNTELVGVSCKGIKLEISNGKRDHELATSYFTDGFGNGPMEITGTVDTYFNDIVIYNQFLLNGLFAVAFTLTDPTLTAIANTYKFILPNMKVSDAPATAPSGDADIMQPISFRALIDPALGYAINVDRSIIV